MTLRDFLKMYGEWTLDMELHNLTVQGAVAGRAFVLEVRGPGATDATVVIPTLVRESFPER